MCLKRGRERVPPFVAGDEPEGLVDRIRVAVRFQPSENHRAGAVVIGDVDAPRREKKCPACLGHSALSHVFWGLGKWL